MSEYNSNTYLRYNKEALLFKLLRIGLGTEIIGNEQLTKDNALSVPDIFFSIKQGVGAFIFEGLQKATTADLIPPNAVSGEIKMKLFSHTMQVEKVHQHHKKFIAKLAQFYAEHGIKMMVLKGYGLSLLYPAPNHRPCGDIDIWLFGEQERADKLLYEKKGIKIDYGHQHHTIFSVDGVMVENHFEFVNVISYLSNRDVERELHDALNKGDLIADNEISNVYYPPVNFNALHLLRHAGAHFVTSEIALRHVTDWAMFVKHYHKEIDWKWLYVFAKKQNMHKFLNSLNGICVEYLGLSKDLFPDFGRDEDLESKVIADILQPAYPERRDLRHSWYRNYIYTLYRWWGNRWKHRLVYREGLLVTFFVLLTSHYRVR